MRKFLILDAILLCFAAVGFAAAQISVGYGNPYLAHHYRLHEGTSVLLNSLELTPGVVRTTDKYEVCGKTVKSQHLRNTTEKMKNEVYAEYGIDKHQEIIGSMQKAKPPLYEIDHLISLELGGADDVKNLWPQPYYEHPGGAHEKDVLENTLHRKVCSGEMELRDAQECIRADWWGCSVKLHLPFTAKK